MRVFIKIIAFFILLFSSFMIYEHYELNQKGQIDVLKRVDPLPEAMNLIEEQKYAEAAEYLEFFLKYDYVKNDPKVKELYEALEFKRNSMGYQSQKALEGVLKGRSDETIGVVSAGVSDFFLFGDLRDLTIEGYHYLKGENVDEVIVGLSTIGVVATGVTMFSAGSSTPLKGGISAVKFIKKSGKMPLWMEKFIVRSAKQVKNSGDIKPIKGFFEDIYVAIKNSGFNTTVKLLNRSPNMKAFHNSLGFAKTFGKESGVLLKVLGDDAPIYYRLLKDKTTKKTFLKASTYGKAGVARLAKMGEKSFLKSLKPIVKTSRLTKIFSKNVTKMLHKIPVGIYIILAMFSLVFLV